MPIKDPRPVRTRTAKSVRGAGPRRLVADDECQLMLLGGVVLVSAFLLTIGVGVEVNGLERNAVAHSGGEFPLHAWRELRVLIENETRSTTHNSTNAEEFRAAGFPRLAELYESVLTDHNLNGDVSLWVEGEADLHDGTSYDAWSHDGAFQFTESYYGSDDGILQTSPCPAELGDAADCIIGVLLRFEVTEHDHDMAEPILFSLR